MSGSAVLPSLMPSSSSEATSDQRKDSEHAFQPEMGYASTSSEASESSAGQVASREQLYEASPDLQTLCHENGISASQFARKADIITSLDIFLGFWESMKSVACFSALRELSIVKQPTITRMEGLMSCPKLEVLWITECGLERIEGLGYCTKMRKLNLSSNRIRQLEQLDTLTELEMLWVNENHLTTLDGLRNLTKLTQLWACRNKIERLDSALNDCVNLTDLNLADNRLCSFKGLLSLANLERLEVLTLSDPHYGDNPVCRLCNYQTYLMCQLSRLSCLDAVELSMRNKQIAEATMIKKKIYYNMRIKAIKRDIRTRIKRSDNVRSHAEQQIEMRSAALMREKKHIDRLLADYEAQGSVVDSSYVSALKNKLSCVNACLQERFSVLYRMNNEFDRLKSSLQWVSDVNITQLLLELETGGNIRLEDGKPSDAWFVSCVDLVRSRLFASDLKVFGIQDIRINRVTRINNRYLRNRFHARMEEILVVPEQHVKENVSKKGVTVPVKDGQEQVGRESANDDPQEFDSDNQPPIYPGSTLENSLEYLFYLQPPLLDQQQRSLDIEQFYATEHGFREPCEYQTMGLDGAIKLSNSLALLDTARLTNAFANKRRMILQQQDDNRTITMKDTLKLVSSGEWEIPSGVLLVVKVFPGYTKCHAEGKYNGTAISERVDAQDYVGLQSLQFHLGDSKPGTPNGKQKLYYLFDKALVLPEYLVEYQYMSMTCAPNSDSNIDTSQAQLSSRTDKTPRDPDEANVNLGYAVKVADDFERRYRSFCQQTASGVSVSEDEKVVRVLQMDPVLSSPSSVCKQKLSFMEQLKAGKLNRLRQLNLLGCGLDAIPDLSMLKDHLEVLVLSYNKIERLNHNMRGLSKLHTLDLSYNQISTLEYMEDMAVLQVLEMNHNMMGAFRSIEYLGELVHRTLTHLDLRMNALCSSKRYRLHVLQHLGCLVNLDQQKVFQDEILAARHLITKLTPDKIWSYVNRIRVDDLQASRKNKPDNDSKEDCQKMYSSEPPWHTIEELSVNRELIGDIEGLDYLVNLRFASFSDNVITQIKGLQGCIRLEELLLEDNEISNIENLEKLVLLKKLNLARNHISSIVHLDALENLTQLSLEDNQITSLRGLGSAMKLMELYLSNNRIDGLKEIQHLKSLPKLTILDLSGNEITRVVDYRLYAVYYLRRVKVLDEISISPQDQSDAKQKYSGKLTMELILEKCGGNISCPHSSRSGNLTPTTTNNPFNERVSEMNLSSCRIRDIGTISGKIFANVLELNLENNQISDITGLGDLPKLRILNLSRNRIERLMPTSSATTLTIPEELDGKGILACLKLEQLLLAYNHISDMTMLGLQFLDDLKVLHLQGNAIVSFTGLDTNTELQELRLDKNKIRQLQPYSTLALRELKVLNMEDNGLKSLSNFSNLLNLETLDLSNNRVVDIEEVDKLTALPSIIDLRLTNNPVIKKHLYRQTIVYKLSTLQSLDCREITGEERERVEALFVHERAAASVSGVTSAVAEKLNDTRAYSSNNSNPIAPSSIPAKTLISGASHPVQPLMVTTTSFARPGMGTQFFQGASDSNRKNSTQSALPINNAPFAFLQQATNAHLKDSSTDPSFAIGSSNSTAKGIPSSASNRNSYLFSNSANPPPVTTLSSSTFTVASAFGTALSPAVTDHYHLGGLRSDRRRITSVHYDQSFNAFTVNSPPVSASVPGDPSKALAGALSTSAVGRGPASISGQGLMIHPSSAEFGRKQFPSSIGAGAAADPGNLFSGYVVSYASQKRHGSYHDLQSYTSIPYMASKVQNTPSNGRLR